MKKQPQKLTMINIMDDPRYRGKHVIVIKGKVFTARTGEGASKILERVRLKYPKETPAITYIPDADFGVFLSSSHNITFKSP
mgnify:CR=1 FL=1